MVWPIMGDACRRSIHLKDGVEASQRVRRSGRSAPSSTLAFAIRKLFRARSRLIGSDLRAWHRLWTDYGLTGVWPIPVRRRSGQVVHHEISDGRTRANNRDVVFHP